MAQARRHYQHSNLAVVSEKVDAELSPDKVELLKSVYSEVCATWRSLHDVRFKLLGLVPFVTVGVLVVILPGSGTSEHLSSWYARIIPAVGLLVTIGLLIYDTRNSEIYDDLISRGRRIEAELGIKTGIFRGRRTPECAWIKHGNATRLIYGAAILGWVLSLVAV
ncbi:hypothetical protein [Marinobacterium aestuarii]|uniref:hypothetical protein n=1 Tax=Marinobacterium aestuarii TaxID=1821621 RepID=UPI0012FFC228|nr:hypothetical protein [Marinobacterium aestuarii]